MQQEQAPQQAANWKDGFNALVSLGLVLGMIAMPFVHRGFGRRAVWGSHVLGCCFAIFIVGSYGNDPYVAFDFFWAWLAALLYRRIETFRLLRKGAVIHSNFCGEPALRFPFVRSYAGRLAAEVLFLWGAGYLFLYAVPGLGALLIAGGVGIVAVNVTASAIRYRRNEMMQDVLIEQQYQQW